MVIQHDTNNNKDLKAKNASVKENNLLLASHANCLQVLPDTNNNKDLKAKNASVKENNLLLTSHANCLQVLTGARDGT